MNIALYAHGGSGNHGCEALVRSTIQAIGIGNNQFTVFSERPQDDRQYHLHQLATIKPSMSPLPVGLRRWFYNLRMKFFKDDRLYYREVYRDFPARMAGCDIALAIGGDNYCYSGFTERFGVLNQMLASRGIPAVLWGCSIDPYRINPAMLSDLRRYRLITARESITYQALVGHGLSNVRLVPDTAFCLPACTQPLPEDFHEGQIVGINISPLIIKQESTPGITIDNYRHLIHYLLRETPYSILLIPHVVWKGNDDRVPLRRLYEEFQDSQRIAMVDDCDAPTLKGYISRCRFMVAARTHASIAAYSTGVPTLVVGYSVKAKGIAHDLFGESDHYVVPISTLKEPWQLTESFLWLAAHEKDILHRYHEILPSYTEALKGIPSIIQEI